MSKESDQFIDQPFRLAVGGGGEGGGQISQRGMFPLTDQQEFYRQKQIAEQMEYMRRFMQNGAIQYQAPVPIQSGEDNIQMDRRLLLIKR